MKIIVFLFYFNFVNFCVNKVLVVGLLGDIEVCNMYVLYLDF